MNAQIKKRHGIQLWEKYHGAFEIVEIGVNPTLYI